MAFNVAGYVFHLLLSRMLGVTHYGDLLALIAFIALSTAVGSIINIVIVKLSAEFYARDDSEHVAQLFRLVARASIIVAALTALFGYVANAPVASFLHISSAAAVEWAFFSIGVTIALPALRGMMQGAHMFGSFAVSLFIEAVAKIVLGFVLVRAGYNVAGAVAAVALASTLAALYLIVSGYFRFRARRVKLLIDARRLIQTIIGVSISTLALALMTSGDFILVKHYFTAYDSGLYGIASLAGKTLMFVGGFVPIVLLPRATVYATTGRSVRRLFLQALAMVLALSLAGLLFFAIFPELVVRTLGGRAFVGAAGLVVAYGAAMSLLSATSVVSAFRIAMHRFAYVARLSAVAVGELAFIAVYHQSLIFVVYSVVIANGVGLAVTLWGVFPASPSISEGEAVTPTVTPLRVSRL